MWYQRTLHLGYLVNFWGFCLSFLELLENHWCERRTTGTKVMEAWRMVALALLHMNMKWCEDWRGTVVLHGVWVLGKLLESLDVFRDCEFYLFCVFCIWKSALMLMQLGWVLRQAAKPVDPWPAFKSACRSLVHWTLPLHRVVLFFLSPLFDDVWIP